jgi:hypothetical protein
MNSAITKSDGDPSFRWKSALSSLTFKFGGFLLGRVRFSIRILDVPFHQLSSRDPVRPDWDSWGPDLSVAAVFGQPIESELKRKMRKAAKSSGGRSRTVEAPGDSCPTLIARTR